MHSPLLFPPREMNGQLLLGLDMNERCPKKTAFSQPHLLSCKVSVNTMKIRGKSSGRVRLSRPQLAVLNLRGREPCKEKRCRRRRKEMTGVSANSGPMVEAVRPCACHALSRLAQSAFEGATGGGRPGAQLDRRPARDRRDAGVHERLERQGRGCQHLKALGGAGPIQRSAGGRRR